MKKKLLAALLAGAMCLGLCACGGSSEETTEPAEETTGGSYNVGICQLVQHESLDAATQGFQDKLTELITADGGTVEFDMQNASGDPVTCSSIINGFVSNSVDLIMANATAALQAGQAGTADIPVVGTSVTDYGTALGIEGWTGTTGSNVTGATDLVDLSQQAALLNELFPEAKNVALLYCSAEPNSEYQISVIKPVLEEMGYTCTEYTFSDSNDVAAVTTTAASENEVIYIPTDNTAASCAAAIRNVTVEAKIPVITGWSCADCGVASLSIDYYELGEVTAELAYEILVEGADPGTLAVRSAPNATAQYNPEICEALGITVPETYVPVA